MKRKTIFRKVMAVFAVGLFLFSCEQQEIAVDQSNIVTEATNRGGMIVLGKKLENPYSVENMKKAYNNLVENGRRGDNIDIATTHYYVRFLPKDTIEYDLISADITVELYDYPLDVEIKEGGDYYHDKSLPKDAITWQYTAVKKDYKFGNI